MALSITESPEKDKNPRAGWRFKRWKAVFTPDLYAPSLRRLLALAAGSVITPFMIYVFDIYGVVYDNGKLNQGLLSVFADLRAKGKRVVLASNMPSAQRVLFWEALGLSRFADEIFCSGDLNVAKPAPLFYSRVEAGLGAEPESILFFDDSAANVEAARSCGWHGFLFTDTESTLEIIEKYHDC